MRPIWVFCVPPFSLQLGSDLDRATGEPAGDWDQVGTALETLAGLRVLSSQGASWHYCLRIQGGAGTKKGLSSGWTPGHKRHDPDLNQLGLALDTAFS